MSIFLMGVYGGLVSFASTAAGAVLPFFRVRKRGGPPELRFSLPIDFALGVMLSASAFSLIGPAAWGARSTGHSIFGVALATVLGGALVYSLKLILDWSQKRALGFPAKINVPSPRFLLAAVLMVHNFPEGLASGAAVAGLGWEASVGILGAISLQNIPEGALMVLCLSAMGWSGRAAFTGGIASGGVELLGGTLAGLMLGMTHEALPFLVALAGGAMMASVGIELLERHEAVWQRVHSRQFRTGFILLTSLQCAQYWISR